MHVLRELIEVRHVTLRRDHPAQAPARHIEILGKTVNHKDVIHVIARVQRGTRGAPTLVLIVLIHQTVINLIDDECAATPRGDRGHCTQVLEFNQHAGGVGWRGHQRRHRALTPMLFNQFRRQLINAIRAHGYAHRLALHQAHKVAIGGVAGVRQQHLITRVHQGRHRQQ